MATLLLLPQTTNQLKRGEFRIPFLSSKSKQEYNKQESASFLRMEWYEEKKRFPEHIWMLQWKKIICKQSQVLP